MAGCRYYVQIVQSQRLLLASSGKSFAMDNVSFTEVFWHVWVFSFIKLPGVFQLQRLRCSEYVAGMLDTKQVMQCYLSKRREQQME